MTSPKDARAEAKATKARAKALRPWYRKKRWWLLGVVVLIVIIGAATSGRKKTATAARTTATTGHVASTRSAAPTATAARTTGHVASTRAAAPTTTAAPKVLYQKAGSGTDSTPNFTAPTNWNVVWTYNCASYGSSGNFQVTVEQAGTGTLAALEDTPINQLGASGSGTQHYHYGGKLYLSINSECSWTIEAVAA